MDKLSLQKPRSESLVMHGQPQPPSGWDIAVTKMVMQVAQLKRLQMMEDDYKLWRAGLAGKSLPEIEKAFLAYVGSQEFFEPASILALIEQEHGSQQSEREWQETQAMKKEHQETRAQLQAEGLPAGLAQKRELLSQFARAEVPKVETDPIKRREQIKQQLLAVRERRKAQSIAGKVPIESSQPLEQGTERESTSVVRGTEKPRRGTVSEGTPSEAMPADSKAS